MPSDEVLKDFKEAIDNQLPESILFILEVASTLTFRTKEEAEAFNVEFVKAHPSFKNNPDDSINVNQSKINFSTTSVGRKEDIENEVPVSIALNIADSQLRNHVAWFMENFDDPRLHVWKSFNKEYQELFNKLIDLDRKSKMSLSCPHNGISYCITCDGNKIDMTTGFFAESIMDYRKRTQPNTEGSSL